MAIVSGYLGAGKTTLINRILSDPAGKRITVLVNDFGSVSLDEKLIINRDENIIALANGCMCCQIGGDLYRTIDQILQKRSLIDLLLVETSGVADPGKIANIAIAEPDLVLSNVLTLVDAMHFFQLLQDSNLTDTLTRQIRAAGLLMITKTEIAGTENREKILEMVRSISPSARVIDQYSDLLSQILLKESRPIDLKTSSNPLVFEKHNVPFDSWSWQGEKNLNKKKLIDFLSDPDHGVFRFKGTIRFDDGSCEIVQKVGDQIECILSSEPFMKTTLTAIGTTTLFDRDLFSKAWREQVLSE